MPDDLALLHIGMMAGGVMGAFMPGNPAAKPDPQSLSLISAVQGDAVTGKFTTPVIVKSPQWVQPESPWIAVDANQASAHQGNVYAAWLAYGSNTKNGFRQDVDASYIAVSKDKGRTYSAPIKIGEDAFVLSVLTRPNGTVDVMVPSMRAGTISHRYSTDGGNSFSKIRLVSGPSDPNILRDYPSAAVKADGGLFACWVESGLKTPARVKCASELGGTWSKPADLVPSLAPTSEMGLPAVAANDAGLWVLAYKSDTKTEVMLYRSVDNGKTFQIHRILGTRNFGKDKMCLAAVSDLDCRLNSISKQLIVGEHVSLAASGRRVAAAFVLPRSHDPVGFANTYVRVIDEQD